MESHVATLVRRYPVLEECAASISETIALLTATYAAGNKLLLCGNGGSASDSEHIVGELMKGFLLPRRLPAAERERLREIGGDAGAALGESLQGSLPAIALTSHTSLATALSNDNGPDLAFSQQVYGLGRPGDVLLGISTSGNAKNVVQAFYVAGLRGMKTIALTGRSGGTLGGLADVTIRTPADETYVVQELHLPIYHTVCIALEDHFFGCGVG